MKEKIISQIKNLKKYFPTKQKLIKAVDDISLNIYEGEIFSLVGESGCGKSTLGKLLLRFHYPDEGTILFENLNIFSLTKAAFKPLRKKIQIIFQDPFSSLNPCMTIHQTIEEPLKIHDIVPKKDLIPTIENILRLVGLSPDVKERFPHEFSGGERQRIAIARVLAVEPKFLVCDEPLSSLDVSTQSQIIKLLKQLKEKLNLTYFFITHDLGVVKYISTRVAVMYHGKIIEMASTRSLFENPLHPYTNELILSAPSLIRCELPIPKEKIQSCILKSGCGCIFFHRCLRRRNLCSLKKPDLEKTQEGHLVACHFPKSEISS